MARIKGPHHVAITVKSMEDSLHFYQNVLGLNRGGSVKMDGFTLHYFEADGFKVELFEYEDGYTPAGMRAENELAIQHFAFEVDDVEQWYKKLQAAGVTIELAPTVLPELGVKVLLLKDPNDIVLELSQIL